MELFKKLEIETASLCNRSCKMCLRVCYPDREKVSSWLKMNYLPIELIFKIIDEAERMQFNGELGLSHYNEPLLDKRLVKIAQYAKNKRIFSKISFCTNGDLFDEQKIKQIDGVFDEIIISRTSEEFKTNNLFKHTKVLFTNKQYVFKHFDPSEKLAQEIQNNKNKPCFMGQTGMYINHKGDMLMCCSDLIGHFELGNVNNLTLQQLWFSEKHKNLLEKLSNDNSRNNYEHCRICPLPSKY